MIFVCIFWCVGLPDMISKQYHIYSNMRVDAEKCVSDGSEEKPHPIFIVDSQGKSED